MEKFIIDEKGLLLVLVEGTEEYACTGVQCEEGKAQEVWDAIPNGAVFQYQE